MEDYWVRAHRVFVYTSEAASGIDCGAAEADAKCKTCDIPGQMPPGPKTPSSCSYAAALQDAQPEGESSQRRASQQAGTAPVVLSESGEQLHPLTRMPMSLYTDTQPSSQLTTASASTQAPSKRTWWQAVTFQRPKPTAPVTPPSPPSPQAQTPTEAATNSTGVDLGQRRQRSTIPMAKPPQESMLPKHQQGLQQGGAQEPVWMYPSEEMFYKAMKRKGWQPDARDMKTVVAIHNTVNERAWQEVCAWESLHANECPRGPRLARFLGRPSDLSPKARILNLLGYAPPFDRHDWIVDRCGKEVRYVIDFYSGIPPPGGPPAAMWLDTRPALDSFEAAWDRAYLAVRWVFRSFWFSGPGGQPYAAPAGGSNSAHTAAPAPAQAT